MATTWDCAPDEWGGTEWVKQNSPEGYTQTAQESAEKAAASATQAAASAETASSYASAASTTASTFDSTVSSKITEAEADVQAVVDLGTASIQNAQADAVTAVTSARASAITDVQTEANTQKSAIADEAADWITAIQSAGSTEVSAVDSEGASQVSAIQSEGATQVAAVQAAVVDIEDYTARAETAATAAETAKADVDTAIAGAADGIATLKNADTIKAAITAEGSAQTTAVQNAGSAALGDISEAKAAAITSINEVVDAAAEQATSAASSASSAASSASTASTAMSEAQSARDAAASSASSASASATSAAQSVATIDAAIETHNADETAHGVNTIKGDISSLDSRTDTLEKASSTASEERDILKRRVRNLELASQGITHTVEEDSDTAYCKTVPSGAMPNCILDSISGRSLVWNQIFKSDTTPRGNNCTYSYNDGLYTMTVTKSTEKPLTGIYNEILTVGHKYYLNIKCNVGFDSSCNFGAGGSYRFTKELTASDSFVVVSCIFYADQKTFCLYIDTSSEEIGTQFKYKDIQVIDLTQLFGEAYCSSRTTTELKADIEQLISEKDYWEYNEGEVISGDVQTVESVGKNILNPQKINVVKGHYLASSGWSQTPSITEMTLEESSALTQTWYYFAFDVQDKSYITTSGFPSYGGVYIGFFDKDFTYVDSSGSGSMWNNTSREVPSDAKWFLIGLNNNYGNDFSTAQAEYSASATTYSPYQSSTLTIPSAITSLPGYGWSAGTAKNYVDYDERKYVQEVGVVDLGTLDWITSSNWGGNGQAFYSKSMKFVWTDGPNIPNIVCDTYPVASRNDAYVSSNKSICLSDNFYVTIRESAYSSTTEFKSAMSGVYLYYELSTPIETDLSDILPETTMLTVEEGGTLTFKSSSDLHIAVPSTESYMVKTFTE